MYKEQQTNQRWKKEYIKEITLENEKKQTQHYRNIWLKIRHSGKEN